LKLALLEPRQCQQAGKNWKCQKSLEVDIKTPTDILDKFEQAAQGVSYGTITLTLFIKNGRLRYVIAREESLIPTDELSVTSDSSEQ
jgi:hypothetical protein